MKKTTFLSIIIAFLITSTVVSNPVYAETTDISTDVSSNLSEGLTEEIKEVLSEEDVVLEEIVENEDEISIQATFENNDEEEITTNVDIKLEDASAVMSTKDEEGNLEEYEINLISLNEDEVIFTYFDQETGELHTYDSTKVTASIVPAIPIGIAISASLFSALAHTSAVIIVGGAAYLVATEAIPKVNKNKKKKQYNHFRATLSGGKLYIGKGLSRSNAIKRAKKSKDVWSVSKAQAKAVAQGANKNGKPIHEIDKNKKGKYYHWHPYKRTPKMHSFYGKAQ